MIANARMYAVTAEVADHWRALFAWVADAAGVPLDVVPHAPPAPLGALWRRPDLGSAFMCGYPWATWSDAGARPALLACVVPMPARYGGRPVYCTDIVSRADAALEGVDDLAGKRFAYTTPASQSGYQAPRALFAARAHAAGGHAFAATVGPLTTPRNVVDAVLDGAADAGPLDSYWHDLLRRHEPATAARLRVLASTPLTASPPLVCAASVAPVVRERLAAAWRSAGTAPGVAANCDALLIGRFAAPDADGYRALATRALELDHRDYRTLQ